METTEKKSERKLSVTGEIMYILHITYLAYAKNIHITYLAYAKIKKVFIACPFVKSIESSTPSKKVNKFLNSNRICEVETLYFPCLTNYTNYTNFAL